MTKLSIIIPVYNEEKYIGRVLDRIEGVDLDGIEKEIIIIDDGSTDNSGNIIRNLAKKHKIIFHGRNKGKGAAVRSGIREAEGDIILIQDADLEYSPEEYGILLRPILENQSDVVYGSRILGAHTATHFYYYLGNKFVTFITNILYNASLTDMETGYKAFRKEVIKNLKLRADRFNIEPEITAKILKKHKIFEVPISYAARSFMEGKKISWKDGVSAVFTLLKYRFIN